MSAVLAQQACWRPGQCNAVAVKHQPMHSLLVQMRENVSLKSIICWCVVALLQTGALASMRRAWQQNSGSAEARQWFMSAPHCQMGRHVAVSWWRACNHSAPEESARVSRLGNLKVWYQSLGELYCPKALCSPEELFRQQCMFGRDGCDQQ